MQYSVTYTILFAAAVCLVCSLVVATTAVTLKPLQLENARLDKQRKVLAVAGLTPAGQKLSDQEVEDLFNANLEPRIVDLESGVYSDDVSPAAYDQRKSTKNPDTSHEAPPNRAKVRRVPHYGLVYLIKPDNDVEGIIIPVEGAGLWSTLYGYLALDPDARTIRGLTFYEHKETPGLGGEVDNPRWKALWPGRLATDKNGVPKISVVKGKAGPVSEDPYHVDGLSGATITSNGVTNLMDFWLGENGFGPYLSKQRARGGS